MKVNKDKKKMSALAVCLLLTAMLAIGGTLAYLYTSTAPVVNTFNPVLPDITVDEDFSGNVKKNVTIHNTGEVDSFIRAKVVITWQNDAGNVYYKTPAVGTDYTIDWTRDGWLTGSDGFYYYSESVAPGGSTKKLFTGATPLRACEDPNYTLHIEILSQSIQSIPLSAVDTWDNVKVDLTANANDTLSVTNKL